MRIWKHTWNVRNGLDSLGHSGCGWDPTVTQSPSKPAHAKGQVASLRSGRGDNWSVHLCESGGNSTGTHMECDSDSPLSPVHSWTVIEDPWGPWHAAVNKTDQVSVPQTSELTKETDDEQSKSQDHSWSRQDWSVPGQLGMGDTNHDSSVRPAEPEQKKEKWTDINRPSQESPGGTHTPSQPL